MPVKEVSPQQMNNKREEIYPVLAQYFFHYIYFEFRGILRTLDMNTYESCFSDTLEDYM